MMNIENYDPFNTAISRKSLSAPMRFLLNKQLLNSMILDYGAGKGADVQILKALGYDIEGYDKYNPEFQNDLLLFNVYPIVTCNYVFNVIADWSEFEEVKQTLKRVGEKIYISVRSDTKAIKYTWEYDNYAEGYWTGKTFQRFYDPDRVRQDFPGDIDFLSINKGFILFEWRE